MKIESFVKKSEQEYNNCKQYLRDDKASIWNTPSKLYFPKEGSKIKKPNYFFL
jgi:hypothetical protein